MTKHQEPKKQHYIPQFLLKNFVLGKKKRIYIFDLKKERSFASSAKDVGHENNFYRHPLEGNQMEFDLGDLESQVAPVIQEIILNGSIKGLTEEKIELIYIGKPPALLG